MANRITVAENKIICRVFLHGLSGEKIFTRLRTGSCALISTFLVILPLDLPGCQHPRNIVTHALYNLLVVQRCSLFPQVPYSLMIIPYLHMEKMPKPDTQAMTTIMPPIIGTKVTVEPLDGKFRSYKYLSIDEDFR